MVQIKRIEQCNNNELTSLFLDCFANDNYFTNIYPPSSTRIEQMKFHLIDRLSVCVHNDGAFGVYGEQNELIAYILAFDYKELKQTNLEQFNKFFSGVPNPNEFCDIVECIEGHVIHLLSMGVAQKHRQKGIASQLIDFISNKYPASFLVGYVSNSELLPFYERRKFVKEALSGNNYLIRRSPELLA
jgi:GNAT superfamily N-acetyltransferase